MSVENLPNGGDEVKIGKHDGIVSRIQKIAGGVEVTVQINDADDETPISGTSGGFNAEDVKKWREEAEKDAEKADDSDNNDAKAEKAQAEKPSAVSKPVAAPKTTTTK